MPKKKAPKEPTLNLGTFPDAMRFLLAYAGNGKLAFDNPDMVFDMSEADLISLAQEVFLQGASPAEGTH